MASAPSSKTKNPHYKHVKCPCTLMLTVKSKSMKRSLDALLKSHPCCVTITNIQHNHHLVTADVVRHRRPTDLVKKKFEDLFQNGHSPSSALESHKFDLQIQEGSNYFSASADGSLCPSLSWCYYFYEKLFKKSYGAPSGDLMLKSLEEAVTRYNEECGEECAKLLILGGDYIVAICTPLMKRVHRLLRASGEMMLVDSAGNMDRQGTRVFMMVTPSVAGGLPLGIILTSSECESVLRAGFELYKSILPESAFYGRGDEGPSLIMTDDCSAERNSLQACFVGALLLLCIFHILQAFWRWLLDSQHHIGMNDRPVLFQLFKDLLNAKSEEEFNTCYEQMKNHPTFVKYKKLQDHVTDVVARCKEWALCFRNSLLTRGNNTNNYCEAIMRILKDKILFRTKAFSLVQLFDFCITRIDAYFQRRISSVLSNRIVNYTASKYFVPERKLSNLSCSKVNKDIYTVKNSDTKKEYTVNTLLDTCSCPVGLTGAPCKHQYLVMKTYNLSSSQFLPFSEASIEMKKVLHVIMNGSLEGVPESWFVNLRSLPSALNINEGSSPFENTVAVTTEETTLNTHSADGLADLVTPSQPSEPSEPSDQNGVLGECIEGLESMFADIKLKLQEKPDLYIPAVQKLVRRYESECKQYDNTCVSAMHSFNRFNNPKAVRIGKRISVQPTAVQRRKAYLGGGRNLQITGRPPKDSRYALEHG